MMSQLVCGIACLGQALFVANLRKQQPEQNMNIGKPLSTIVYYSILSGAILIASVFLNTKLFTNGGLDRGVSGKILSSIFYNLQKQKKILHGFESRFFIERQVILNESKISIGSVRDLQIDSKGNYWIADSKDKNVKIFSKTGTFVKTIGKGGAGPGEFGAPFCLAFSNFEQIFVGDPANARISSLNQNGDFIRSFSVPDVREIIPIKNTQLLVVAPEFGAGKGLCLHLYTNQGVKIKSFFDIPQNAFKFNMILDNGSACTDTQNNIYAVYNTEYKINKYSHNGNLLGTFDTLPHRYEQAPSKFDVPQYSRNKMLEWINSWAQVLKLVHSKNYIVACLSVHKEHEYELDIFSEDGKLILGNIRSDYRLLSSDREGLVYFLSEEEAENQFLRRIIIARILGQK